MGNFALIIALVLAIPTNGISILIYLIANWWVTKRASEKLKEYLLVSYVNNQEIELHTKNNKPIKHLFKTYSVRGYKDEHLGPEHNVFSGFMQIPGIPVRIFGYVGRNKKTGYTYLSATPEPEPEMPPSDATAEERIEYLQNLTQRGR